MQLVRETAVVVRIRAMNFDAATNREEPVDTDDTKCASHSSLTENMIKNIRKIRGFTFQDVVSPLVYPQDKILA